MTYAQSRYRWGKLVDSEPSRFIEEIDDQYLEYLNPVDMGLSIQTFDGWDVFDIDKSKLRLSKLNCWKPPKYLAPKTKSPTANIRRLKPVK